MPKAIIQFVVPEEAGAIADVLGDAGATLDDREGMDHEEIAAHLADRVGMSVDAELEDDDPLSPICDLSTALEAAGCAHWGVSDAFVEQSRGLRVLGRIHLLEPSRGGVLKADIPWQHGFPSLDAQTLIAAGIPRAEAERINEVFRALPNAPRAAPRP